MAEHGRAKELLDRWRDLERQLQSAQDRQRVALVAEIARVKREYAKAFEDVADEGPSPHGQDPAAA
jgi:hypothetical protein